MVMNRFAIRLTVISAFTATAQENSVTLNSLSSELTIHSEAIKSYGNEKKMVFVDNVVVLSDNFTLTADSMSVYFKSNALSEVEKIVCNDNVNFKTKDIVSLSNDAELNQTSKTVVLSGDVKVWQSNNLLEGDKVTIFYLDNRVDVDKGAKKRVTVIINSDDKENPFESGSKKP